MNNLWVIGDSYSYTTMFNHENVWVNQLTKKLNYQLKNLSMAGCSQDYICQTLLDCSSKIKKDDQIIIVLTGPNRFWFFEEFPDITHSHNSHVKEVVGNNRAKAAEMYFQFIQRPQLDILHTTLRLSWLNHMTVTYGWKKPLVILGFKQEIGNCEYPDLIFSNGSLTEHVSQMEQVDPEADLFIGADPRYNHMILKNHNVLTDKIYDALTKNKSLDLTEGFYKNILTTDSLYDKDLIKNELCPEAYDNFIKNKKSKLKWITK